MKQCRYYVEVDTDLLSPEDEPTVADYSSDFERIWRLAEKDGMIVVGVTIDYEDEKTFVVTEKYFEQMLQKKWRENGVFKFEYHFLDKNHALVDF